MFQIREKQLIPLLTSGRIKKKPVYKDKYMFKKNIRKIKKVVSVTFLVILSGITIMPASAGILVRQPATEGFYELVNINTDRDFYIAGERLYFKLSVISTDNSPVSSIVYLILRNRSNSIIESSSVLIDGNTGFGSIYLPDTLSSSVFELVAFTNWMRNFGEDIYASKQIKVINRFDEEPGFSEEKTTDIPTEETRHSESNNNSIGIKLSQTAYGTREKVRMKITPSGPAGLIESVSVSVAQKETFVPDKRVDNFQFHNDIIQTLTGGKTVFLKETNGPVITGQLVDRQSREGISGAKVLLTTADTVLNLLYANTLPDGIFHFELNDYYDGKDLFFSVFDKDIADRSELRIIDKFMLEQPFTPDAGLAGMPGDFVKTSQDIVRVNKTLEVDLVEDVEQVRSGYSTDVYSLPAFSFGWFTEYEYLDNLHEIARELIPFLRIRRNDDVYRSNIMLEYAGYYMRESPVYFLDGIFTDDINRIIHLNSDDLAKLDVHHYRWRHGELLFPGIVSIFSTNESYRNLQLSEPSVVYRHRPAANRSLYVPPDYEKGEITRSRPDFRQLLFWHPEINSGNSGEGKIIEFFTGDIQGEFIITATGYSREGEIITSNSSFLVNNEVKGQMPEEPDSGETWSAGEESGLNSTSGASVNLHGNPADTNKHFEQVLSGMMDVPSKKLIGDENYPSGDWLPGTVLLDHGRKVSKDFLRYNGYTDELFWLYEGDFRQIQIDRKMVNEFSLNPSWSDHPLVFRRIKVNSPLYIGKSEIFGQLLYEGNISLYAYRRVIETRLGDKRVNNRLIGGMIIKPSHLYVFVMPDGTTRVTKKTGRGKIAAMFPEHRKEIRRMLRKNRVRSGNEQGLIDATRLINIFLMEKSAEE